MKIVTSLNRFVPISILATLTASHSVSGVIVGTVAPNLDGTYSYSYLVDNSAGAFDIASWSLEFGFLTPDWNQLDISAGGDVTVPDANWIATSGIPVSGLSAQDFLSINPASDVLAGGSLSGFSFKSSFAPATISYFEFSAAGDTASGTTIGPAVASVPEGGAMGVNFVALTALGALGSLYQLHRRTTASTI